MVFSVVINKVVFYWETKDFELSLGIVVLDPVKLHVCGFLYILIQGDFGEGLRSIAVNLELGGGLWVTILDEAYYQGDRILGNGIGGTYFRLSHQSHDIHHDIENGVDGFIVWWVIYRISQILMSTSQATGTAVRKV